MLLLQSFTGLFLIVSSITKKTAVGLAPALLQSLTKTKLLSCVMLEDGF